MSWYQYLQNELALREERQQIRKLHVTENGPDCWITKDGKRLLNLASNNYLGLAGDKRLIEAAIEAASLYGAGATASRLIVGNYPLYEETEQDIANWKGTERALLIGSGYTANLGALSALLGRNDVVYSDRLNHASITDGIILSRAEQKRYKHNDLEHLEKLLQETPANKRKLIVTDTVFSMDGDTAYLRELVHIKEKYNALLMVDEAHASGVYGQNGAGLAQELVERIDLHMGTFSKALGCSGAYLAGSKLLMEYLTNTMRSFIFTTGMPPSTVGSIKRAVEIVRDESTRRALLMQNGTLLRDLLKQAGFNTGGSSTHIVPIVIGSNEATISFSQMLQEKGIAAIAVRPPTVPENSSRIRLTVTSEHKPEEIREAVKLIAETGLREGVLS
ncbi:8-amino-7-oxononanoate synthase [Domibacillus aminovorans]|uniref:8-amino-7-ketopelargonate synthase n=1 Tax=Domibacillus aminovorans TaxID=29332 RepID=A0A177L4Z4_9BACI|nr:8-amino-7-oxononanoate synthase [Domibacillus aminovorans]OAH60673.1 8-amino-7-oxononanoate synthase [Domibacillus aminovorans]